MKYGVWHVVDSGVETFAYGTVADWEQYCNFRDDWADGEDVYKVSEHDTLEQAQAGAVSHGNLPFHLACHASVVYAVEFTGNAPRGAEYTLDDMVNAGATLRAYTVREV